MFALRGLAVCLSFFAVVYAITSGLISQLWRFRKQRRSSATPQATSALLLTLRALPLLSATLVTLAIVLPSFIELEPRTSAEPVGEIPAILALCCLSLFVIGFANALLSWRKTNRIVHSWLEGATAESRSEGVSLFRIRPAAPALAVAGICAPRVLLSDAAVKALTEAELKAALKHELAHVRRRDNLKKLFLRITAFPGMSALETEWSEATEMAADDAAVSNNAEALDLAAALIKISRIASPQASPTLTTALVPSVNSALNARIERLVTWEQHRPAENVRFESWYVASALLAATFCVVVSYGALLTRMHQMTEWLVK
jgi:beta-lactamase regulating signal transducer with metallopeptidase domain